MNIPCGQQVFPLVIKFFPFVAKVFPLVTKAFDLVNKLLFGHKGVSFDH